jgi:hypothetical protein
VSGASRLARAHLAVGDQVLRFTSEGAYAGASLVVEAKRDASYTVTKALAEVDVSELVSVNVESTPGAAGRLKPRTDLQGA